MLLLAFAPALACANIGHHLDHLDHLDHSIVRASVASSCFSKKKFIAVSRRTLKRRTRPALLFTRRNLNLYLDLVASGSTDPRNT